MMSSSRDSKREQALHNKVAIITGASRGIGRTLALAFAREGASIVAAARKATGSKSVEETVSQITRESGRAIAVQCDVTSPEDVKALVDVALRQFGRIDLLVNNAGVGVWKDIRDMTVDDWNLSIGVNLKGVFLCCKYAIPSMIERRSGHIINLSSSMALRYVPEDLAYSPTKAGLNRFSINLANDVRQHNIAANCYGPGYVQTDMARKGSPQPVETVVPAALWLAQQTAPTFTGQVVDRREFGKTWGPGIPPKV